MLRRDYLVNMIQEMTEVLGKVFQLKQERKFVEALWEVDELYRDQFRLQSTLLRSLSAKDIVELFRTNGELEGDKLQSLARLMKEEGSIYKAKGQQDEAVLSWMKALHLYLAAGNNLADRHLWHLDNEISELMTELKGYRLSGATDQLLLRYQEAEGRFDQAENILFRLLYEGAIPPHEGATFYERLLEIDPQVLAQGGLPLDEVKEGQEELVRRFLPSDN
jgi:hypothetical protein